ncbi:MAG: SPFH domain-containing protein, partial [Terriglobales bacterium]
MIGELIGGLVLLTGAVVLSGMKFVNEYDRLVVFRFGRAQNERGPGFTVVLPVIERAQKVDTR